MSRLLAVLLCTVTLAGCSSLGMTRIPDELLACKDAPPSPAENPKATMEDGALYVPELAAAGQDCRSNLGDVRRLLKKAHQVTTTPPHDPNYARLDQRVTGLESAVSGIASAISDLGKKLDERSRPQWMLLVGALGLVITLLGVIGAAWKAPIDGIVARQEMDLRDMRGDLVPRVEIDAFNALNMRERDEVRARLDRLEGHIFPVAGPGR